MASNLKDLTVFIGRFSPFHNGHAAVLSRALRTSKAVLVLVGSSGQARTTKNPFSFEERRKMIHAYAQTLPEYDHLVVKPLHDHPYNDHAWMREVQDAVDHAKSDMVDTLGLNPKVHLTGADRDKSTWYLHAFGDLFTPDLVTNNDHDLDLSATKVRDLLFSPKEPQDSMRDMVPPTTLEFLIDFQSFEDAYIPLCKEYEYIEKYKKDWQAAPYAPTFNTVDACVIQSGHVLVNVRDNFPGKGLWALPGGFLEQGERLIDGAVRELLEETRIELSKAQLYGSIKSKEIFDHPDRSLRGRTLTVCYLFKLDDSKPLPRTKPQKGEVKKVMWVPINEALRRTEMWFEDHHPMLSTMYGRLTAL
jgi:bifunctional NMN adenylyltransferase/nudix hydrolase